MYLHLFRIHCYELYFVLQEYAMNLSINFFDSDAERDECYMTHNLLDSIWNQSRCRHQVCGYIHTMINEVHT